MEKSIETIWNEGFLRDEGISAPKVNNLYKRKSKLLLEKIKSTYRTDNKSIIPIALISLLAFGFLGHVILGIYLAGLMMGMFFLNKQKLNALEGIVINGNSYDYLLKYRESIKNIVRFYTRLLGLGLPVAGIIGYWLYFQNSKLYIQFLELEVLYIILIILAIGLGLSAIGILAYRLSTRILYGNLLHQLDAILEDLRELRV